MTGLSTATLSEPAPGIRTVLLTPPGFRTRYLAPGSDDLAHSRPRLDAPASDRLAERRPGPGGLPARLVRRIQQYVDAHLDSSLKIDELAVELGISMSHFAHSFRKAAGLTPHNYVMQRRLARAQELLLHTNRSLVDIALATGFFDQSHFSRCFHQLIGVPPRAFRVQRR